MVHAAPLDPASRRSRWSAGNPAAWVVPGGLSDKNGLQKQPPARLLLPQAVGSQVNRKLACVEACSQGVVGEGSRAEQPLQGQTAAARWLGKPKSVSMAESNITTVPMSRTRREPRACRCLRELRGPRHRCPGLVMTLLTKVTSRAGASLSAKTRPPAAGTGRHRWQGMKRRTEPRETQPPVPLEQVSRPAGREC